MSGIFNSKYFNPKYFDTGEVTPPAPPVDYEAISGGTTFQELLEGFPDFVDKRPTDLDNNIRGVHNSFHSPIADLIDLYNRDMQIVQMAMNLDRPVKLWIDQQLPNVYTVNYIVTMWQGLSNVQLYLDGTTPTLLQDSDDLDGATSYSDVYSDTSTEILPTKKYFVLVTDSDGNVFQKGYPENDTIQGDIYDHDHALDDFGVNWDCPRRTYLTDIEEANYSKTFPPYYTNITEADYFYEMRIRQFQEDYANIHLPLAELRRNMSFLATLIGRWRETGNVTDSCIMDIYGVLQDIPANINFATSENCQAIVNKACPCGKQCNMIFIDNTPIETSSTLMSDYFNFLLKIETSSTFLTEYLTFTGQDVALYHDTGTDFAPDVNNGAGCEVVGTGSAAVVELIEIAPIAPVTSSIVNGDCIVTNVGNVLNAGLVLAGFDYSNMSPDAVVTGAELNITNSQMGGELSGSWNFMFTIGEVEYGQKTVRWNGGNLNIGGENDLWSDPSDAFLGIPTDPNIYIEATAPPNSQGLGVAIFIEEASNQGSIVPNELWEYMTVTLTLYVQSSSGGSGGSGGYSNSGNIKTNTIPLPVYGTGWYQLISNQTTPTNTNIQWNIINANTGATLLSNQSAPVNLFSISFVPLKIQAVLNTSSPPTTPDIDWFKLTYNKKVPIP
jgi:DNA-directed RNA polymerase subunit N (RpoN/RPB10)